MHTYSITVTEIDTGLVLGGTTIRTPNGPGYAAESAYRTWPNLAIGRSKVQEIGGRRWALAVATLTPANGAPIAVAVRAEIER